MKKLVFHHNQSAEKFKKFSKLYSNMVYIKRHHNGKVNGSTKIQVPFEEVVGIDIFVKGTRKDPHWKRHHIGFEAGLVMVSARESNNREVYMAYKPIFFCSDLEVTQILSYYGLGEDWIIHKIEETIS